MVSPYSVLDHGRMIADPPRTDSYRRAIEEVVRPGAVVLDIGTGTGVFALFAARCGARLVYAVEPDGIIELARQLAVTNGLADRITFIQGLSTEIELAERADVVVSDLHGVLPLFESNLPTLIDARDRLLRPGGTLIPRQEEIWAALVSSGELYRKHLGPYGGAYDLDLAPARTLAVNCLASRAVTAEQLFGEPQRWVVLDYWTLTSPSVRGTLRWPVDRGGLIHGLVLWFDTTLADGIGFSNAPGQPCGVYGRRFFPLAQPLAVVPGKTVSIDLRADLVGGDYLWRWRTTLRESQQGRITAHHDQSTFAGQLLSKTTLRRRSVRHVPGLGELGQVDLTILRLMADGLSVGDIGRQIVARFPDRFPSVKEATLRVGRLAERYGAPLPEAAG